MFSSLNKQPREPEDDNSEEEYTPEKDLFNNSAIFGTVMLLSNCMALDNGSSITNFKKSGKKVRYDFCTK